MREERAKNKHTLHLLIITVLVFGVYLRALEVGFLAMDDISTMRRIQSASISIGSLLFSPGNDYYRPLTILSFHADFLLFGNNPAGYHLTNILLHLANSVLVYFLATELLSNGRNAGSFSFFTALLFALHPINSEAVIWISGRTDLLCCFFALICLIILLKWGRNMTPLIFLGLVLSLLFSLASKESSLFLPLLAIIYFIMERKTITAKNALSACSALSFAVIVYLLLRKGLPVAQAVAVKTMIPAKNHTIPYVVEGTAALGFYLQKLFYPFPLSIAITEIATNFCLALFLSFCGVAAILWKKISALRFPLAFLGTSLVPPLGVLFLCFAWTPYAERYLYLPSVAFALCTGTLIHHYRVKAPGFIATAVITLLAIPAAYRVNLWTKPIPFWEDAVVKSPYFGTVRLPLVAAYIEAGRLADAEKSLREADSLGLHRKSAREFSHELWKLLENRKTPGHTVRSSSATQPAKTQQ